MNDSKTLSSLESRVHGCPICGDDRFQVLARHDRNLLGVQTVGCNTCGLIQTNPRLTAEGLELFYREYYRRFYQGVGTPDAQYIADLNKDVRLAYTAQYFASELCLMKDAAVLDYGCGEGSLFAALRKSGFTGSFFGVELNAQFGEFASKYGNATVATSIKANEPIDLVIVNHVLEHLADPESTLRSLGALLKDGGRLYVDVPDAEAYASIYDLHIAHIYHFTVRTLCSLVEKAGLIVQRIEKHEPPFHPPSIRLVAGRDDGDRSRRPATTPATEAAAWQAVRNAGGSWNAVRLRMKRSPRLVSLYRRVMKISRRTRARES